MIVQHDTKKNIDKKFFDHHDTGLYFEDVSKCSKYKYKIEKYSLGYNDNKSFEYCYSTEQK